MRKVKIYSVVSLEGYACDEHEGVDWLVETDIPRGIDFGINRFFDEIGTVVMTRHFYSNMFICECCHNFRDKHCVIVRTDIEGDIPGGGNEVEYVPFDTGFRAAKERIKELIATEGGDIWVAGGIGLVGELFDSGMIDEVFITMVPVSLGSGIRLFPPSFRPAEWKTRTVRDYGNGYVQLIYQRKREQDDEVVVN